MSVRVKRILLIIIAAALGVCLVLGAGALCINAYVKSRASDSILTSASAAELEDVDCILVLGCLVKNDGSPSDMLSDRLSMGVELYELGAAPKLLMSGDHGTEEYDEVNAMKSFAVEAGVPSEDVFMDHAGFSTYDSMYRAAEIFGADKIVIVTQGYHLYRAVYIARELGIEAYGVASDQRTYRGQIVRDTREVLARNKDFLLSVFKPQPTYLGDTISLEGDGNVTAG